MKQNKKWIVTKEDERPNGAGSGHCFYCPAKIGEEHKDNCVIRERAVVINFSIDLVIKVPEFWSEEDINFHRNESSWCANNVIDEIVTLAKKNDLCNFARFKFVREADIQDEKIQSVNKLGDKT